MGEKIPLKCTLAINNDSVYSVQVVQVPLRLCERYRCHAVAVLYDWEPRCVQSTSVGSIRKNVAKDTTK